MAHKSILLLALVLACTLADQPFYAWSQLKVPGIDAKAETHDTISPESVVSVIEELFKTDNAFSAILYKRTGLTTDSLLDSLANNNVLKFAKKDNFERAYTKISSDISTAVSSAFGTVKTFVIENEEDFEKLVQAIKEEAKPFIGKIFEIQLPEFENEEDFNILLARIEALFEGRTYGKHISAIVGGEAQTGRRNL